MQSTLSCMIELRLQGSVKCRQAQSQSIRSCWGSVDGIPGRQVISLQTQGQVPYANRVTCVNVLQATFSGMQKPVLRASVSRSCCSWCRFALQRQPEKATSKALSASALEQVKAAQGAAMRAIVQLSFGQPPECRGEVHKALLRALKTGTAARKVGAAQVLQHALAPLQASLELYELQVIPALVATCSTGMCPSCI
jgi:hypothetical protein